MIRTVPVGPRGDLSNKQLIAHRGASAYAPEHTLAAYRLAIEHGADYVEQDLAVTRDGALICLHDDTLDRTSNVAEVYRHRFSEESAGQAEGGRERLHLGRNPPPRHGRLVRPAFAGQRIVTWQEAIDLVRGKAGLYPELKSPPFMSAAASTW
jgi:glycerophosphoryl diester phosphodiesterase